MKHPFLKSILVLGSVLAFVNCGEDNSTTNADPLAIENQNVAPSDPAWQLDANGQTFLIYPAGIVTDATGAVVGNFVTAEGSETVGTIVGIDGVTPIFESVDTSILNVTSLEALNTAFPASSDASFTQSSTGATTTQSSAANTVQSSNSNANNVTSSANTQQPNSSATTAPSSSSQQQQTVVTNGNVTVTGNLNQTVAQGATTSEISFAGVSNSDKAVRKSWNAYFLITEFNNGTFYIKATNVPPYFEAGSITETFEIEGASYELKLTVTKSNGQGNNNNNNQQPSSSSQQQQQQPSSSSQQQQQQPSSSSRQQQQQPSSSSVATVSSGCPNIVTKGAGGSGFASRYWDGCKPSCSWKNNAGSAGPAKQCNANGKTENTNYNAKSVCDGGSAATCTSQIPFTVDGCTNMGFAFAAVPASNGGQCGKCFQLTFTGEGKYSTDDHHKAIKGKKLIVMVTNIGSDVNQGQFDIMIPGGGVGIFNGTAGYGWGNQGAQYGGLLSDCENASHYDASTYKSCLTQKCNSVFSNDAEAKQGCLFLANFMDAAGNPLHNYVEVECPEVLKSRY